VLNLERPKTPDELYLERGADVGPYRPVLTGDVFADVAIPGVGVAHSLAMVISHPCNMRVGDRLRDRIQMLPIVDYQDVPLADWSTGAHARVFMLPECQLQEASCAARFDETGMVASGELTPSRRRLALSERGVLMLLQRQVFSQCRVDVPIEHFDKAVAHVLAEAELLEEWNEALVTDAEGDELVAELATQAKQFDDFMGTTEAGVILRDQLKEAHRRSNVRRLVRDELARKSAGTDYLT